MPTFRATLPSDTTGFFGAVFALLVVGLTVPAGHAQRGTGPPAGDAVGERPAPVMVKGTVTAVEQCPCGQRADRWPERSTAGTHLRLETADGSVNLHLGPAPVVADLRSAVTEGTTVAAEAVRTAALPDTAYVATSVTVHGDTYRLRDARTLRPRWSGRRGCAPYRARGRPHHPRGRPHHAPGRHRRDGGCCW